MNSLSEFYKVGRNLWTRAGRKYRLAGEGITPNGCCRINPRMVGLSDIDACTGKDVRTGEVIFLGNGAVSGCHEVLRG